MLKIVVPEREYFDENTQEFVPVKQQELILEHSLISISKWEAKWHKPFLAEDKKQDEEFLDYIRCMTLNNVDENVYYSITRSNMNDILEYIDDSHTATTFSDSRTMEKSKEIITSEIIYYWMILNEIPFECQKWHINRLLTLIKVCSLKNAPSKKMSKNDILSQNMSLNKMRRAMLHSKG
jgi:hypothetical protein